MSLLIKNTSIIASTSNANAPQGGRWLIEHSQQINPSLISLESPRALHLNPSNYPSVIKTLLDHYREAQPKAGRDYWTTRVWTLITWQPVYLCLYSVHLMKQPVNLSKLQQRVMQASVYGYSFESSVETHADFQNSETLFQRMTQQLKNMVDELFESINTLMPLNKANSYGLIADTVMHGLLALKKASPLFDDSTLIIIAKQWCQALGLVNRKGQVLSELKQIDTESQHIQLVLKRKSCCKHYLVDPNDLCSSCSRQCWQTRIKRQSHL